MNKTWIQNNIFNIVQLLVLLATMGYGYGVLHSQVEQTAQRLDEMKTRIVILETKNDQLATVMLICQQNTAAIEELRKIVSSDHDLIIRLASLGVKP